MSSFIDQMGKDEKGVGLTVGQGVRKSQQDFVDGI